ncbi:MAG: hypothetical protein K6T94_17045 [Paenibacillus sp.]|nr:hypothetical protein [Paenibacillus sp.]
MELSNLTLMSGETFDESVLGVVTLRRQGNTSFQSALLQEYDMVVLMLHEVEGQERTIRNTLAGGLRIQTQHIDIQTLERAVSAGDNNELVTSLLTGEVVWDPQGVLEELRWIITQFEQPIQERVLLMELARFLHMYVKSKRYIAAGCVMDAYNCVLIALYHWARIEVSEGGRFPEPAVWDQVKSQNTSVYKLYEELTISTETLEQRVQLVLLACEFAIMSKMADCCTLLFTILGSRKEPWGMEELLRQPGLSHLEPELPLLLSKLVSRSLIREITSWADANSGAGHAIRYTI